MKLTGPKIAFHNHFPVLFKRGRERQQYQDAQTTATENAAGSVPLLYKLSKTSGTTCPKGALQEEIKRGKKTRKEEKSSHVHSECTR